MDKESSGVETKEELLGFLDSSYPLLQKFRETCPGTHKHSQALSAMIEGVMLALSLDPTYGKIAALYHDIGKMFNPKYFSENQLDDDNPHDKLDPIISYNIITRHVSDSTVILLNEPNFPRAIIEIASQHHGTSVLKSFFNKSDSDIEDVYRYKTAKPTCVEAAILMICDRVEASSRSLIRAGKFNPSEIIEGTINQLLDDGQLDSVYMRLGDLKKIKEALAKELAGTYQKRVDYDKTKNREDRN